MREAAVRCFLLFFVCLLVCQGSVVWAADPTSPGERPREAEPLAKDAPIDLKPHFSPLSVVELFVAPDCKTCRRVQQKLNELEASAGTRRGRVIFLTYNLPPPGEDLKETLASGQLSAIRREQIKRRWEQYGELLNLKRRSFPELLIDGRKYLTMTKVELLDRAISKGLIRPTKLAVSLEVLNKSGDAIKLRYSVSGLSASRSDDLYFLTILAVEPQRPVPVYTVDGVDTESIWQNSVHAVELIRLEENETDIVELPLPENLMRRAQDFVAILQDARTGVPVAGEIIRGKALGR